MRFYLNPAIQYLEYDILISGMGPAAMAVAFEAIKQGKRVALISCRADDFVRVQSVYLTTPVRQYLKKMPEYFAIDSIAEEDKAFFDLLDNSMGLAIKDIERYLKRRLDHHQETGLVTYLFNSSVQSINLNAGLAIIKDSNASRSIRTRHIRFKHLIGADGSHHHAANILNKTLADPIYYRGSDHESKEVFSPRNKNNLYLYAEMKRKDGEPFTLPMFQFLVIPGAPLTATHDTFAYHVFYVMFSHDYRSSPTHSAKFGIGMEAPEELLAALGALTSQEDKTQRIIEYLQPLFYERLEREGLSADDYVMQPVKLSRKHGKSKDKLKYGPFDTDIRSADKAIVEQGEHQFILVGDAFRKPFFHISHGLNDAIVEATWIAQLLSGDIDAGEYNDRCLKRSAEISSYTQLLGKCFTSWEARWDEAKEVENRVLSSFNKQEPKPEMIATRPTMLP